MSDFIDVTSLIQTMIDYIDAHTPERELNKREEIGYVEDIPAKSALLWIKYYINSQKDEEEESEEESEEDIKKRLLAIWTFAPKDVNWRLLAQNLMRLLEVYP